MGKSKIITYVVVAVLVLVGAYWAYRMMNKAPEAPVAGGVVAVSNTGGVAPLGTDQASQFVSILNDIDNINLQDRLILTNKIFTSLKDFGRKIEDRATGRENPFAPFVGGTGIVTNQATSTDQGAGEDNL